MKIIDVQKNNFCISTNKKKLNINFIHQYLNVESYWAKNIPKLVIKKSIQGSVCFGVYDANIQIGFARVITDKATFGYIADVFIDKKYRGKGLSKWLMKTILDHPNLQGFRSWMLATKDAHSLYAQFGFAAPANPDRLMRKVVVGAY